MTQLEVSEIVECIQRGVIPPGKLPEFEPILEALNAMKSALVREVQARHEERYYKSRAQHGTQQLPES